MKPLFVSLLITLLLSSCEEKTPARVRVENGNVFIVYVDNTQKEVPGVAALAAVLSPDNQKIAFIQEYTLVSPDSFGPCGRGNNLTIYDIKTHRFDTLIESTQSELPEKNLLSFNQLAFSPDGQALYFTSCAWVTSNAIHRYDIITRKEKFITSGNSLKVVESGKYKGYLIVSKHKYYEGEAGGSYEHYWLVDTNGKEIKDIGESEDGALE